MRFLLLLSSAILLLSASTINGNELYSKALQYLNGSLGGEKITKEMPRCPYERCKGKKKYTIIKKDLKKAYTLLNKASKTKGESSEDASFVAARHLLKQINYKSKEYDAFLVKRLKNKYGINAREYDSRILFYLRKLTKATKNKYKCFGAYKLYNIYKNGYLHLNKDVSMEKEYQAEGIQYCSKKSFEYLMLSNSQ